VPKGKGAFANIGKEMLLFERRPAAGRIRPCEKAGEKSLKPNTGKTRERKRLLGFAHGRMAGGEEPPLDYDEKSLGGGGTITCPKKKS